MKLTDLPAKDIMTMQAEDARFSRSGTTNPLGKCTENRKIALPAELAADIDREAARMGMTFSEWVRELLPLRIYGTDHMQKLHGERLLAIANGTVTTGPQKGTE